MGVGWAPCGHVCVLKIMWLVMPDQELWMDRNLLKERNKNWALLEMGFHLKRGGPGFNFLKGQ